MTSITSIQDLFTSPLLHLRSVFAFESFIFILESSKLIVTPSTHLLSISRSPLFITPLAAYITRIWGSNALALALPLAWSSTSYATARERKLTYWLLGTADAFAIVCGVSFALFDIDSGLTSGLSWQLALGQTLPLAWRIYCLYFKPLWFENGKNTDNQQDLLGISKS